MAKTNTLAFCAQSISDAEKVYKIHTCGQCHKSFYGCKLALFKISYCLSLALSTLVKYLWVRAGVYPRVKHLKGSSLGQALALPANIRLSSTCWTGKNALAYYEKS